VSPSTSLPPGSALVFVLLGLVAGALAALYQTLTIRLLTWTDRWRRCPVELRAMGVGAAVGVVAWFAPGWVGGGDRITQQTLGGAFDPPMIVCLLLFRFCLGPVSYAAGTPGGIFAPMLVVGAQVGWLFALACPVWLRMGMSPESFAVVGMAAFFIGVVRAPLTGILLIVELTDASTLLLPLLAAGASAMLVPALLRLRPIYEVLKDRTLAAEARARTEAKPETDPGGATN